MGQCKHNRFTTKDGQYNCQICKDDKRWEAWATDTIEKLENDLDKYKAMCERLAGALERGRWSVTKEQSVEAWGDLNEALAEYNAMLGKGEVCQHDYIVKRIDGTCPKCTSPRRQGKGE